MTYRERNALEAFVDACSRQSQPAAHGIELTRASDLLTTCLLRARQALSADLVEEIEQFLQENQPDAGLSSPFLQ
jgi:hypothetical protein